MQRVVNSLVRRRLGEEKTLAASTRSRHGGDGDGGDDDGDDDGDDEYYQNFKMLRQVAK